MEDRVFSLLYLTPDDIDIIKVIKEQITDEGIINIRRICRKKKLNKLSFFMVLKALYLCDIAESKNLGIKGTYVKIKDKAFFDRFK